MQRYSKSSEIHAQPAEVFAWHEQPGAVERLTPPWEKVEMVTRADSLAVGARVIFRIHNGPFSQLWEAEHTEYQPPHCFVDVQRKGPFADWHHRHRFEQTPHGTTKMTDEIDYAVPLGWLEQMATGWFVRAKLEKMFAYRHRVVLQAFQPPPGKQKA